MRIGDAGVAAFWGVVRGASFATCTLAASTISLPLGVAVFLAGAAYIHQDQLKPLFGRCCVRENEKSRKVAKVVQPLIQEEGLKHFYFAYGSNVSFDFLKERLKNGVWIEGTWNKTGVLEGVPPNDLGVYELDDYEFGYNLKGTAPGEVETSGNIVEKRGAKVYGALYEISDRHLTKLDKEEDVDLGDYVRVAVKVKRFAEKNLVKFNSPSEVTAFVYVGNPSRITKEINPDSEYVRRLCTSAEERRFPENYIRDYLLYDQFSKSLISAFGLHDSKKAVAS